MNTLVRFGVTAAGIFALCAATALADGTKPIRTLVYTFDITLLSNQTVHTSGIGGDGPESGMSDYNSGNADQGTIKVDVMGVQPDTGLVVQVSENGRGTRTSEPTMCVAYGNGAVICDESKGSPNEEEYTLLRLLGRNFVNHSMIDAKNHWQYAESASGSKETNDYTITSTNGDLLAINVDRVLDVTGPSPYNATTNGQITYNEKLSVPTKVKEFTITRKRGNMGGDERIDQHITLTLSSDSMATASTP